MAKAGEIGIPFSAGMVVALYREIDPKNQTRRVMSPQPHGGIRQSAFAKSGIEDGHGRPIKLPYGDVGQRLWVREPLRYVPETGGIAYVADNELLYRDGLPATWGWKVKYLPSRYCPRWPSRTMLEVVQWHVQRLQEINEADAKAEGVERYRTGADCPFGYQEQYLDYQKLAIGDSDSFHCLTARDSYRTLWDLLNAQREDGIYSWAQNPMVWAYTVKIVG